MSRPNGSCSLPGPEADTAASPPPSLGPRLFTDGEEGMSRGRRADKFPTEATLGGKGEEQSLDKEKQPRKG